MSSNGRARGIKRERDLRELLENCGWVVIRAPGSLGPVDILAIATGVAIYPMSMRKRNDSTPCKGSVLLIQAKSTVAPYAGFGPSERRVLLEVANSISAAAWLAHKPKSATRWNWIPSADWPDGAARRSSAPAAAGAGPGSGGAAAPGLRTAGNGRLPGFPLGNPPPEEPTQNYTANPSG